MSYRILAIAVVPALLLSLMVAQDTAPAAHDMSNMKDMPGMDNNDADSAMQHHHMDMGPHMRMSELRDPRPGDAERAAQVVVSARAVAEKYKDYRTALADGFKIFHPNIPQKQYHFTNYSYAFEAAFSFHPEHPTSLLYEKHGDDYKLIGVMYTAPKRMSEEELDQRVPLSVAQWHQHVNFCAPPPDQRRDALEPDAKFGLRGSITTQQACDAAGGTFKPVIFGWMVHVYPFEQKPEDIWAVDRQLAGEHDHHHAD